MPTDITQLPLADFIAATAAKSPTPGGGSVAALAGALGSALAQMSIQYSLGKKNLAAHQPALAAAMEKLQRASDMLLELIAEDIAAYDALSAQLKLPKETRAQNADFLPALAAAIAVPESILGLASNILTLCGELFPITNPFLHSDLILAGVMANAAARGAELNVLANLPLVPDPAEAAAIRTRTAQLVAASDAAYAALRARYQA